MASPDITYFYKSFENYAWATFPVHCLAKVKINFRGEKQIQIISQVSNIAHSVFSGKIVPKLHLLQNIEDISFN